MKLLLKQKILAVYHDFHWLLVDKIFLTVKFHSFFKESEILGRSEIESDILPPTPQPCFIQQQSIPGSNNKSSTDKFLKLFTIFLCDDKQMKSKVYQEYLAFLFKVSFGIKCFRIWRIKFYPSSILTSKQAQDIFWKVVVLWVERWFGVDLYYVNISGHYYHDLCQWKCLEICVTKKCIQLVYSS